MLPFHASFSKNKLNFHSFLCLFLGYNPQYKGYICESPSDKRYITRHVLFNESVFPYSSCFISSDTTQSPAMHDTSFTYHINSIISASPSAPSSPHPSIPLLPLPSTSPSPFVLSPPTINSSPHNTSPIPYNAHPMFTRGKYGIFKPRVLNSEFNIFPSTLKEALQNNNWVVAMQEEYDALRANHTWTLTSPPSTIKPIGCKWVLKNKYNADDYFQRHKARLIAKEFHQHASLDY